MVFEMFFKNRNRTLMKINFSASLTGKHTFTFHFRLRYLRMLYISRGYLQHRWHARLIFSFYSYFKIKVLLRYFNLA
jgi:hypothetical protein